MSTDNVLYQTVPVTYSAPVCTPTNFSWTWNSGAGLVHVDAAPNKWPGAKVIYGSKATFPPNSTLKCTFSVTANRPSPSDKRCQSTGTPKLWNTALADIDPAYNPTNPPFKSASVSKPLPLCRNVTITKVADPPIVIPGDPVKWTITITNEGPTPNGPIGNFKVSDTIDSTLLPITAVSCAPVSACTSSYSGAVVTTNVLSLAALSSATVTIYTKSPTTAYVGTPNTAKANPSLPGFYFHDPDPQGTGSVYTAWPQATKRFDPNTIGKGGVSTLIFTIDNLSYKPAVQGMSFTDPLPGGLGYGPVTKNTCGGSATLGTNPDTLIFTNGLFAAGVAQCTIEIKVTANACQSYVNRSNDVTNINKVGTSGLNATLSVGGGDPVNCESTTSTSSTTTSTTTTTTTTTVPPPPGPCPNGECVKAITGSGDPAIGDPFGYGCALLIDRTVKCWGSGPLGRAGAGLSQSAQLVTGLNDATAIDSTSDHVCVVTFSAQAKCWGSNSLGQLGDGTTTNSPTPTAAVLTAPNTPLTGVTEVAVGPYASCAVATGGSVWCWGPAIGTVSTTGPTPAAPFATQVAGISGASSVTIGANHVCVLTAGGTAKCWGKQQNGQLGNGLVAATIQSTPVPVVSGASGAALLNLTSIKAGVDYTCAVSGSGASSSVLCWGGNFALGFPAGLLGTTSTAANVIFPLPVTGVSGVSELSVSGEAFTGPHRWAHNCVVGLGSPTGVLTCWGGDEFAQIGLGSNAVGRAPSTGPVVVRAFYLTPGPDATRISANNGKTCAIKGATVQCWGARGGGQVGDSYSGPLARQLTPFTVVGI
jgi:uncharacterized repeat protein (TIGR01451 family)